MSLRIGPLRYASGPGPAGATKVLVSGFALVDAALKAERDPIRAQATELVKAKSATRTARGKAKAAKKASPSPRPNPAGDGSSPLTPAAQGAVGGGPLTSEGTARRPKTNPPKPIRP